MYKIIILILLLVNPVYSASIHGTVYDFSLEKINNIIVEINTQPNQRQISRDSTYSFEVPKGSYKITAKTISNNTIITEDITVNEEGNYTLDLIGFIELEEDDVSDLDIEEDLDLIEEKRNNTLGIIILIVIMIGLVYFFCKNKFKRKKEIKIEEATQDSLKNKVLEIIKKEEGRITQKDIRKQIPYSEAKISLVITELESEGKIQKIKKGRGNVIILKT